MECSKGVSTFTSNSNSDTIKLSKSDCDPSFDSSAIATSSKKYSRMNTLYEKRRMRRARMKRKRTERIVRLENDLREEHCQRKRAEENAHSYKSMSRTYWERWRWELHKRKEAMVSELHARSLISRNKGAMSKDAECLPQQIDQTMLSDPVVAGKTCEQFIGRGCFSIVKLQLYRGMEVAVKEFLPRSVATDVLHESSLLASLCHPYLPLLYGVSTKQRPHKIVMQFHGIGTLQPSTIWHELQRNRFDGQTWLLLFSQLMEAVYYLHEEVHILHNDIKVDNVLVTPSVSPSNSTYQVVLIDFGKATRFSEAKRYNLTDFEKREYMRKYPHIAPEVIEGDTKQTVYSDMYSLGKVLRRVLDDVEVLDLNFPRAECCKLTEKLISANFYTRPTCKRTLEILKTFCKHY